MGVKGDFKRLLNTIGVEVSLILYRNCYF